MFFKLIEEFSNIIKDYSVSDFRKYGSAASLVAKIEFLDNSVLHIKDYLFIDNKRKYSYHWQDNQGNLISRWDNSPHHFDISTFPHHQHLPQEVIKSQFRSLKEILTLINQSITRKNSV